MTKILLVEDDKSLREIYNVRLGAEGYDIVSAGDGEEALALAIKERPDLIVSDVMMPKISGFDMLDILRSTTETKNVKVIMMTALSNEEQRRRGLALGADRYLVKSQVGIEDVVRTVHEVLEDDSSAATGPAPLVSSEDTDDDIYDISAPEQTESTSATMTPPRPSTTSSITLPARPNPSAAPQSSQPRIITQPTPAPITPPVSPPATTATPTPVTAPVPVSSASSTMSIASATTAPQPSTLPQPVAPFSTPRPGSSGHIIQPLEHDNSKDIVDITARMSQELAGTQTIDAIPAPQPVSVSTPTPQPAPITPPVSPSTTTTASPTPEAIPTAFTAPTAPDTPPIDLSTVTNRPGSDSLKQEPALPSAIAANTPQPITSPVPSAPQPQPQPLTSLAPQAQKSPIPQQQTSAPTTPSPSYTAQSAPITPQPATPAQGGSTEQPATNQTTPPLAATPPLPASSTPPTPTPTPTPATTSSNTSGSGLEFEETARADTPASQTML
jgi:PAS/PAC sensor hybrid histidine kinase